MSITSRDYSILRQRWLPEIEACVREQERCSLCRKQNRQPWKDLCPACTEHEHMLEDERIRSLDNHGFVTECIYGCACSDVAVWIIGCDYYHIWSDEQEQYCICVTEERSVVCENCIQNAFTRPFLYQKCVVWMRNVRLIRKVREAQTDALIREVADLLAGLGF